jgi:signal transduction histidine kinase
MPTAPRTARLPGPGVLDTNAWAVLDSMQKHIAVLDQNGDILVVNQAWRQFALDNGASAAQADPSGSNYLAGGRGSNPQQHREGAAALTGIAAVLAGQLPNFEFEYPCHSKTEQRWFLLRATPLSGPAGGAVVLHENITQRRLHEDQRLRLIADLQAANGELSEFAHVVSHDLKAPLRGISSLASWLTTDFGEKLGDQGRQHVDLIASRCKRLSAQIDAILAYSRAGLPQDEPAPVALGALVNNVIDLLAPPPHIRVEIVGDMPSLNVEAVKVQQLFQNLISNAIDFSDKPEGRITVSCEREATAWRFSVSDNGPGIEQRHFVRIFGLFQTLASRDERERTGVGLSLVKKIVERIGGRAWVESTIGIGSVFHFTVPDRPAAARD